LGRIGEWPYEARKQVGTEGGNDEALSSKEPMKVAPVDSSTGMDDMDFTLETMIAPFQDAHTSGINGEVEGTWRRPIHSWRHSVHLLVYRLPSSPSARLGTFPARHQMPLKVRRWIVSEHLTSMDTASTSGLFGEAFIGTLI
jgi:hypothetical protein